MRVLSANPQLLELGGREVIRVDCQCVKCKSCKKRAETDSVTRWRD
jgi:hypothetical protein